MKMYYLPNIFKILLCILYFWKSCKAGDVIISLTSPVVFDTPIYFVADLSIATKTINYDYYWKDDTGRNFVDLKSGSRSTWNITYLYPYDFKYKGRREVTVSVYFHFIPIKVADTSKTFELTDMLSGNITATQPNMNHVEAGYVSTYNSTNFTTSVYDPSGYIHNYTEKATFYFQIINRGSKEYIMIGPCLTPSAIFNITKPGDYFIESNVVLSLGDNDNTTGIATTVKSTALEDNLTVLNFDAFTKNEAKFSTSVNGTVVSPNDLSNSTTQPPNTTTSTSTTTRPDPYYQCDGYWGPLYKPTNSLKPNTKYGVFYTAITAREPLSNFKMNGSTWFSHGQMLELHITCTGTGPFQYCINLTYGAYNESEGPICTDRLQWTNTCDFIIYRYLKEIGVYTLVFEVYNKVSEFINVTSIHTYQGDRKSQLSHIIVPVACSLIAIVIIIFGIAQFIQSSNRFSIEVADFDFCASEETEYKTFFQQLKESLYHSCTAEVDDYDDGWNRRRSHIERPRILEEEDSDTED